MMKNVEEDKEIELFILKNQLILTEILGEIHNIRISKKDTLKELSKKLNIPFDELDKFELSTIGDINPKVFFAIINHYRKEIDEFIELNEQIMNDINPDAALINPFKMIN